MQTWRAVVSSNAAEVLEECASFLASDPFRHNVVWTLLQGRAECPGAGRYAWVSRDDEVVGVSLQSPSNMPATISPMDCAAVAPVVSALRESGACMPGVTGQAGTSTYFAGEWAQQARVGARPTGADCIYAATNIRPPAVERGSARRATGDDAATLIEWLSASHAETGERGSDPSAMVTSAIAAGQYWVWDVDGPVSMAASTRVTGGVTRVRGVYTPPAHRSHGYAAACVAALARQALDECVRPMLYTDLQNPVSNAVYRRIGFCAIDHVIHYEFT